MGKKANGKDDVQKAHAQYEEKKRIEENEAKAGISIHNTFTSTLQNCKT